MLAQLIQALYNIIDSFFIGNYSESGLTALSIIYPIQLLMIALAVGTGVAMDSRSAAASDALAALKRRTISTAQSISRRTMRMIPIVFRVFILFLFQFSFEFFERLFLQPRYIGAGNAAAPGGLALRERGVSVQPVAKAEDLGLALIKHVVDQL